MGLEFEDTNGINQSTDFTGQDQAASDPGPAPASEGSNQPDGWATGQSQDIDNMFHRFSPQQQLMASKIGLFGSKNLPADASGRPSYNAFTDSYAATDGHGRTQEATTQNDGLQFRSPLKERLGFDPDKIFPEEYNKHVNYEPTTPERRANVGGNVGFQDILVPKQVTPMREGSFIASSGMLNHYDADGRLTGRYPYTSGTDGVTDPSIRDKGPIPPGGYSLDSSKIKEPTWKLPGDWGNYFVPLAPNSSTNTYNRSGFYLHGGSKPGSKGCIDIGSGDKTLFPKLIGSGKTFPLTVEE